MESEDKKVHTESSMGEIADDPSRSEIVMASGVDQKNSMQPKMSASHIASLVWKNQRETVKKLTTPDQTVDEKPEYAINAEPQNVVELDDVALKVDEDKCEPSEIDKIPQADGKKISRMQSQ